MGVTMSRGTYLTHPKPEKPVSESLLPLTETKLRVVSPWVKNLRDVLGPVNGGSLRAGPVDGVRTLDYPVPADQTRSKRRS
jgi:hypothetical protein